MSDYYNKPKRKNKHPKHKKNPIKKVLFFITTVLLVFVTLFVIYKLLIKPPEIEQTYKDRNEVQTGDILEESIPDISIKPTKYERKKLCYTFLIAASDQASGNADVIMVMTYDTVGQKIGIVSIPRDTLVDRDFPKISSAYHYGIDLLRDIVSDMLGIPIDFFITVDVDGFVKLVDTVGGVEFDVPCHMSYDDPDQDLFIHFEPGIQYLDGEDALKILRWRKNSDGTNGYADADIGRTKTQHKFLKVISKKVFSNPQKLLSYIEIFTKYVKTDLTFVNIVWFTQTVSKLDIETGFSAITFPGDGTVTYNGIPYCYQLYPEHVLETINSILNPYTEDITLDDMNICEAS